MAVVEITSASASALCWAPGETGSITITVKNTSGSKFTNVSLSLIVDSRKFTGGTSGTLFSLALLLGESAIVGEKVSWAAGKSRTFTGNFTVTNELSELFSAYPDIRAVPIEVNFTEHKQSLGATYALPMPLKVINCRFNPQIAEMNLDRAENGVPNDEGESVLTTLKLSLNGSTGYDYTKFFKARMYQSQGDDATTADSYTDLTPIIGTLLSGVTNDASILTGTYSKAYDWDFLLEFGDEYETFYGRFNLGMAFANLHLSGKRTGGACFGGFSTSKLNNPKLESYYPIHAYGGIKEIGAGWAYLAPLTGTTPGEYGGGLLRCRKIENKCIVDGSLLVKPAGSTLVLADLPDGYTPEKGVFSINACSGGRVARISVGGAAETNAGKLCLSWVKNLENGADYTAAAIWVQCSIEYWVEAEEESEANIANLLDANGATVVDVEGSEIALVSADNDVYQSRYTGEQIDAGIAAANNAASRTYVDDAISNIQLTPGENGKSAYEIAVDEGFEGDEATWLESLRGSNGKSAYAYAQDGGYTGTEDEFAEDLANIDKIAEADSVAWKNITGKPFGNPVTGSVIADGDTLKWDGNTEGMHTVAYGGDPDRLVYASHNVPTLAQIQAGCVIQFKNTGNNNQYEYVLTAFSWADRPDVINLYRYIGDVQYTFAYVALVDGATDGQIVFDRAGTYYNSGLDGYIMEFTVSGYTWAETTEIGPIPDKYIPNSIARVSDVNAQASVLGTKLTNSFASDIAKTNQSISDQKAEFEASDLDIRHDIEALRTEIYDFYDETLKEVVWREDAEYGDVIHDNYLNEGMVRVSAYVPKLGGVLGGNYWYVRTNSGVSEIIDESTIAGDYSGTFCISQYGVWVIAEDNTTVTRGGVTTTYPKKGTYFPLKKDIYGNQFVIGLFSTIMQAQDESITLKPEHLPELTSFIMKSASGARWQITISADGEFEKTAL